MEHQKKKKKEWKFFSFLKHYITSFLENIWKKLEIQKAIQTQLLNSNLENTKIVSDSVKDFTVTNLTFASICVFLIQPLNP